MAALSEEDMRKILGADYRPQDAVGAKGEPSPEQLEKRRIEAIARCDNHVFTAGSMMLVGVVIFTSNALAISGPSVAAVGLGGVALFILGGAWLFTLRRARTRLALPGRVAPAIAGANGA